MGIRLKETPFELDGKTYTLRCNMNVLADVQEACGGSLDSAMRPSTSLKSCLIFLAAMLNDSADENGWPERFTARELGRRQLPKDIANIVIDLVIDGLTVDAKDEDQEKN